MPVGLCEFEYRRAGFCSACGTPLTYRRVQSGNVSVTIGSLDDPEATRPTQQFGIESELSWTAGLSALPAKRTQDWMRENGIPRIVNRQYSAQQPRTDEGIA